MSSPNVTRPLFYEGQILASADLTATVDYARQQMARHEAFVHIPGIVTGCGLTFDPTFSTVTVGQGIVTDGTGREIVIPSPFQLDPSTVLASPQKDVWYPVFIVGVDQQAPPSSNLTGACNPNQPTRMQEYYQFQIGPAGPQLNTQTPPVPGDTVPGNGSWKVLLGFVQFDTTSSSSTPPFAKASSSPEGGAGPQYVGINAAEVESPSGSLLLSTHPPGYSGANPVMGVQITEANGGQLIFGKVNPDGSVTPGAVITSQGLVPGAVAPGTIQVQSGIACDGMTLPMPLGISLSDIGAREVAHIHVSLRMDNPQPPSGGTFVMLPLECSVDSNLQVHCRVQWIPMGGGAAQVIPSLCDYTVIVAVPASGGGS